MSETPTKRNKEQTVLKAVSKWAAAYAAYCAVTDDAGDEAIDKVHEEACKGLSAAQKLLSAHTTAVKEHPGADYYISKLHGKEVRKARCKICGRELNPRGVTRHVLSPVCKSDYADLMGLDGEGDADELAVEVATLRKKYNIPEKSSGDGDGDGDGGDD